MEIGNTWQYSGNMCRKHQEATCCTCCPMISRLKLFRTVQLKSKYKIDSWASESFLARRKSLAKDVRKISGVSNSAIISLCKILLFRKIGKKHGGHFWQDSLDDRKLQGCTDRLHSIQNIPSRNLQKSMVVNLKTFIQTFKN